MNIIVVFEDVLGPFEGKYVPALQKAMLVKTPSNVERKNVLTSSNKFNYMFTEEQYNLFVAIIF